jgi:hypothetical protein
MTRFTIAFFLIVTSAACQSSTSGPIDRGVSFRALQLSRRNLLRLRHRLRDRSRRRSLQQAARVGVHGEQRRRWLPGTGAPAGGVMHRRHPVQLRTDLRQLRRPVPGSPLATSTLFVDWGLRMKTDPPCAVVIGGRFALLLALVSLACNTSGHSSVPGDSVSDAGTPSDGACETVDAVTSRDDGRESTGADAARARGHVRRRRLTIAATRPRAPCPRAHDGLSGWTFHELPTDHRGKSHHHA